MKAISFFQTFYVRKTVYYIGFAASVLFVLSYFFPVLFTLTIVLLIFTGLTIVADAILLYSKACGVSSNRIISDRLSNGDDNKVTLKVLNHYGFVIKGVVIDELPFQFQERNWFRNIKIEANKKVTIEYTLKPLERGAYEFGNINLFISSPLQLVQRRYSIHQHKTGATSYWP
jgi:uncharacterized protein (DUF58 family)